MRRSSLVCRQVCQIRRERIQLFFNYWHFKLFYTKGDVSFFYCFPFCFFVNWISLYFFLFLIKYYHLMFIIILFWWGSEWCAIQTFFSCPLYFFPYSCLSSYLLLLPHFILAVLMHECFGKHLCMSSYSIAILNGSCFLHFVIAMKIGKEWY